MAWERRGDNRSYFYLPRRVGGRVVRDYFGSGPVGQFAADVIAEARDRRAALVQARKAKQARLVELDGAVDRLDRACALMTEAALTAGGRTDARKRRRGTTATAGAGR
jgi:hypothetical protein